MVKSPYVLAVLAQKGGVGKSTFARSIAVQGLTAGLKAAIIDADPQATSVKWAQRRAVKAPTVEGTGDRPLAGIVDELKGRGAEFIVIDTPPHAQPLINLAAELADAALILTRPYPDDLQEVGIPAGIVKALGKPAGIVLNDVPPGKAHAVTMARGALAAFPMPTCPTALTHYLAHPYASAEGLTAQEREPNSKAAAELAEVWAWFSDRIAV